MRRRVFVQGVAAGLACVAPGTISGRWGTDSSRSLRDDLAALSDEAARWRRIRQEFLLNPGLIHLNSGTIGASPRSVLEVVSAAMLRLEGDPATNVFGPVGAMMEAVRLEAAALLGAGADEVALTANTTEGMNAVATGLRLEPGDEVLTTTHEHPGGLVGWEHGAERQAIRIVRVPMPAPARDKGQILQLIGDHLTTRTRVCSVSHVDTITGLRMPLAEIAALTRPRGILLVCDGAQAPGMLRIDVKDLGVDAYASSSHKWLLAPKGTGLLYVRKEVQDRIRPVALRSGYGAYTASSGTRPVAQILGHGAAIDFHNAIGRDQVEARCLALNRRLRKRLAELSSLRVLTPENEALSSGILTVALLRGNAAEIQSRLYQEKGIVVKHVPIAEYNALRFSTHLYNSEAELDRAADSLARLV